MEIRRLAESDARAYWDLRLEALVTEPAAFGDSPEEHQAQSVEAFAQRLGSGTPDQFVLGAFDDKGELVATVGFYRVQRRKQYHRGWIVGMYVTPRFRAQGLGRRLIEQAIARAAALEGIEQILLSVTPDQESALRLYRKLGFQAYGLEPKVLHAGDRFVDQLHMILDARAGG